MKFYIATDQDGRCHVETAMDRAAKIGPVETLELEPNQTGIKEVLQHLFDHHAEDKRQALSNQHMALTEVAGASLAQPEPVEPPKLSPQAIHEWLLDHASQREVEEVFVRIGTRWGEARGRTTG